MKTSLFRIPAIAVLAAMSGLAQNHATLQANVPFAFMVGNKTMPAGHYLVDPSLNAKVMVIESADWKRSYSIIGTTVKSLGDPGIAAKLTFHRYGSEYFLSEVWSPGGQEGRRFPQTPRERELISQQSSPAAQVTLALR